MDGKSRVIASGYGNRLGQFAGVPPGNSLPVPLSLEQLAQVYGIDPKEKINPVPAE